MISVRTFLPEIKTISSTLGCVVRMVADSILPQVECGPNDHRKDAPRFFINPVNYHGSWPTVSGYFVNWIFTDLKTVFGFPSICSCFNVRSFNFFFTLSFSIWFDPWFLLIIRCSPVRWPKMDGKSSLTILLAYFDFEIEPKRWPRARIL